MIDYKGPVGPLVGVRVVRSGRWVVPTRVFRFVDAKRGATDFDICVYSPRLENVLVGLSIRCISLDVTGRVLPAPERSARGFPGYETIVARVCGIDEFMLTLEPKKRREYSRKWSRRPGSLSHEIQVFAKMQKEVVEVGGKIPVPRLILPPPIPYRVETGVMVRGGFEDMIYRVINADRVITGGLFPVRPGLDIEVGRFGLNNELDSPGYLPTVVKGLNVAQIAEVLFQKFCSYVRPCV